MVASEGFTTGADHFDSRHSVLKRLVVQGDEEVARAVFTLWVKGHVHAPRGAEHAWGARKEIQLESFKQPEGAGLPNPCVSQQTLEGAPVELRLLVKQDVPNCVGANELAQFAHGNAVAQISLGVEVEDVEDAFPRLVLVVSGQNACAEFVQPCTPIKMEVRVQVKHDEFAKNRAQLCRVVGWGVMDQTWHVVALLTNSVAGEEGMERMGKPKRHRDEDGKVPHEG